MQQAKGPGTHSRELCVTRSPSQHTHTPIAELEIPRNAKSSQKGYGEEYIFMRRNPQQKLNAMNEEG